MKMDRDYYRVLGVPTSASREEIQRAYRRLARRYHPDSREVDTPTMLFHQIQEAYAILGDADSRRDYDRRRTESAIADAPNLAWNVVLSRDCLPALYRKQMLYVLVRVEPGAEPAGQPPRVNLCLVIDRSTSMKGARLEQVKTAAHHTVASLDPHDAMAVVAFDDRAEVVIPARTGISRSEARTRMASVRAKGGTEILRGLRLGLEQLETYQSEGVISHLILITDGRTYGDDEECVVEAQGARLRGISITTLGIGDDWNDSLLDQIAFRSGGTSAYIASPARTTDVLRKKVSGLKSVVATGLTLQVHPTEGVRVESASLVSPYVNPLVLHEGTMRLGSLERGTSLRALLEISVEQRPPGGQRLLQLELQEDARTLGSYPETLTEDIWCLFINQPPDHNDTQVPVAVVDALRKINLYRMQEQVWTALDEGSIDQATRGLEAVAAHLFASGQYELAQVAALEAKRVSSVGQATGRGRKTIRYGTRTINTPGDTLG